MAGIGKAIKGLGLLKKSWKDKRISAINRKIKKTRGRSAEDYAQEASDIYKSKAPSKKLYKSIQKKFHALTPDQQSEIWMKKARRTPGNIHFDKKRFGKK
jgi:Holliday junction resolvase RusA-like endonuclease